ncbi:MAG: PEP-CTERM sorting domain-containing protein, partial [Limisphaerales bacterium]
RPGIASPHNRSLSAHQTHDTINFDSCLMLQNPHARQELSGRTQSLPYLALFEGTDYTVYGAYIPADLDGQTETLIFGMQGGGQTLLDDINFVIVPEPSGCALMGLGAVALLVFRRLWQSGSPAGIAIYHPATVGQLPVDDCSLNG